jgi:hypothetical protein
MVIFIPLGYVIVSIIAGSIVGGVAGGVIVKGSQSQYTLKVGVTVKDYKTGKTLILEESFTAPTKKEVLEWRDNWMSEMQ